MMIDNLVSIAAGKAIHLLEKGGVPLGKNKNPNSETPYGTTDPRQNWMRSYLSWRYIRGFGLEIGALHSPLPLYHEAEAKYVDFMSQQDARIHYPELSSFTLVTPDYVENGEELPSISENSQDFIIANHFIEHCENPIKTIKNLISRLKKNGLLFMAVPMRDYTFDKNRPLTTYEHLAEDYIKGAELSRKNHYLEWSKFVEKAPDELLENTADDLMSRRYSIHYHVWNFETFRSFLLRIADQFNLPFEVEAAVAWAYNPFESIYILRNK